MSFGLPDKDQETLDYGGYLKVSELTALQHLRSDPAHHDETLFIIIHQTYELWFKQILHELGAIVSHIAADEVLEANRLLRRCTEIQAVLIHQVDILETITPVDFLAFRDHLRPASGFQSAQFREIETFAGLRNAHYLEAYHKESAEYARISERMAASSLGDEFYSLLRRRGFELPEGGDEAHETRMGELVRLYREAEKHYELFLLTESLIEFDERFTLWRLRHVKMVERIIGPVTGTGGSSGAGYLWTTVDRKFFPDLWEVRGRLGNGPAADSR